MLAHSVYYRHLNKKAITVTRNVNKGNEQAIFEIRNKLVPKMGKHH